MHRTPLPQQPISLIPASHLSCHHWISPGTGRITIRATEPSDFPCLFSPIHYEAGYRYPLVVWLHSEHGSEHELRQVMPLLSPRNYVGVAPRGTCRSSKRAISYQWLHCAAGVADACERVRRSIQQASVQFNVHDERIFIAGYGLSGTMALRVALEHPELFAGAISLGGRAPRGLHVFRRLNDARKLPILVSVSPQPGQFTLGDLSDDLRLLHSGGFSVSVQLYPDGDGLTDCMLARCDEWIMERACPGTVSR